MNTVPCHWCWAQVQPDFALNHAEWHRANRLHSTACANARVQLRADRVDDAAVEAYCVCGVGP